MSPEKKYQPQLFILRLWPETLANGQIEWRGKLHHTQTNETRYFHDWPALIPLLLSLLRQADLPVSAPYSTLLDDEPFNSDDEIDNPFQ
ncbi:MAG: hypothetical protein H6669_07035 [Ardenticatenaceae bacterium]|nr:hypothetical protein [Ardenticatenaceae bacterium]